MSPVDARDLPRRVLSPFRDVAPSDRVGDDAIACPADGGRERNRRPLPLGGRVVRQRRESLLPTVAPIVATSDLPPEAIRDLLKRPEGEDLEFETQVRDPRGVGRILAALANSGGGHLVIGWDERTRTGLIGALSALGVQQLLSQL
jgi:hypothetical protein